MSRVLSLARHLPPFISHVCMSCFVERLNLHKELVTHRAHRCRRANAARSPCALRDLTSDPRPWCVHVLYTSASETLLLTHSARGYTNQVATPPPRICAPVPHSLHRIGGPRRPCNEKPGTCVPLVSGSQPPRSRRTMHTVDHISLRTANPELALATPSSHMKPASPLPRLHCTITHLAGPTRTIHMREQRLSASSRNRHLDVNLNAGTRQHPHGSTPALRPRSWQSPPHPSGS